MYIATLTRGDGSVLSTFSAGTVPQLMDIASSLVDNCFRETFNLKSYRVVPHRTSWRPRGKGTKTIRLSHTEDRLRLEETYTLVYNK